MNGWRVGVSQAREESPPSSKKFFIEFWPGSIKLEGLMKANVDMPETTV